VIFAQHKELYVIYYCKRLFLIMWELMSLMMIDFVLPSVPAAIILILGHEFIGYSDPYWGVKMAVVGLFAILILVGCIYSSIELIENWRGRYVDKKMQVHARKVVQGLKVVDKHDIPALDWHLVTYTYSDGSRLRAFSEKDVDYFTTWSYY
jgi:hypothetical protein